MAFERLKKWWRKVRKRPVPRLHVTEEGFSIEVDGVEKAHVSFGEVREIVAFKRDMFGFDLICFGFRCSEDDSYVEADEEMSGYSELQGALERRFGIKLEHWFMKVAFPAFEANFTTLWGNPYTVRGLDRPET